MIPSLFPLIVAAAAALVTLAVPASAQCPQNLCDCVGSLASFVALGGSGKLGAGTYSDEGDRVVVGTYIEASACFQSASLRARLDGDGDIGEDIVLRNGVGSSAAKFRGYRDFGTPTPGFTIGGDILTGGGSVRGTDGIDYDLFGSLLIGGNDPRLLACQQAVLDAQTASAQFAATLPVQKTYPGLIVDADTILTVGPGVQVIQIAGDLRIAPGGAFFGNTLIIETDIATELVIINVSGDVVIADDSTITSDLPEAVVINATGTRRSVKIGKRASVDVPILAPDAAILVQAEASVSNIWTNRKMSLLGATVADALVCDPPEDPAKIVFVSSEEYDGAMVGSLANADALCQQLASDEALTGTFKAWLSDSSSSASSRLSHALVSYTLTDGTLVAGNWADLNDGTLAHTIDQDESGFDLDPLADNLQVWTATLADGSAVIEGNCLDWSSSDDLEDGGIGQAGALDSDWTAFDATSCDDFAHLYCIQQ